VLAILMVQFVAFVGALVIGPHRRSAPARRRSCSGASCSGAPSSPTGASSPPATCRLLRARRRDRVRARRDAGAQPVAVQPSRPARREAEFYSFYQISDRGTNIIGPAALAFAYGLFGSYRQGILVLIVLFVAGGLLLVMTDMRKGIDAVGNVQPKVL
jgi:hypothetical protein